MDVKAFPALIVGVVVALVLAGAVLPVFAETTSAEDTFKNTGYFHMEKYGTDTDITVSWDHTDPQVITVNDVDYSLNGVLPYNQWTSVIIADDWYFRYADGLQTQFVQVSYGGIANVPGASNSNTDISVVCSEGTATITAINTGGTQTKTATYTELYVISGDTGPYVMKKSTESAYMSKNSVFVGLGTSQVAGTSNNALCRIDGTIENGADVVVVASTNSDTTLKADSTVVNTSNMAGYKGYNLSTIQFVLTNTDGDTNITYSYFVVPYEVSIEKSVHPDGALSAMLNLLPLLAVAGLVVGAVVWFIARKA